VEEGVDMAEETRRWGDRAWDVVIRGLGIILLAVSGYFFSRLSDTEKKIQQLEVNAAVTNTEKAQILMTLGEIKADVKSIKQKVGTP
jgi:hypothetical protein